MTVSRQIVRLSQCWLSVVRLSDCHSADNCQSSDCQTVTVLTVSRQIVRLSQCWLSVVRLSDCHSADNCQSSDCQTVTVLTGWTLFCVPVSGKIFWALDLFILPLAATIYISGFLGYLGKVSKFDISLLNLCAQTSWKISVCTQIVSERNNVGF